MILYSLMLLVFFLFYCKFQHYVPVLMYHRIADVSGDRNALPPEKFREQMDYLVAHGFTAVTMRMVHDYYQHGAPLPGKPVLLTFDDGYVDNFSEALPILQERNMTGVVFPIANWIGKKNEWENFHKETTTTMDWMQLKAWRDAGMEIASHTVNHPFLSQCSPEQLRKELRESKSLLEHTLQTPIEFLCYPYGDFNDNVANAAKDAGYHGAFAIFDHAPIWRINSYALPRIPIPAKQKMWEFKLKVSGIHVIFICLRQWERSLKKFLRQKNRRSAK